MPEVVTVKGLDELARQLEKLSPAILEAAEQAVQEETEATADDMRRFAPERTGELKRGIQAERDGLEGRAVATARHSTFVEHGTSDTPEQPFAAPAAELSRKRFPERVGEIVKQGLKELGK